MRVRSQNQEVVSITRWAAGVCDERSRMAVERWRREWSLGNDPGVSEFTLSVFAHVEAFRQVQSREDAGDVRRDRSSGGEADGDHRGEGDGDADGGGVAEDRRRPAAEDAVGDGGDDGDRRGDE